VAAASRVPRREKGGGQKRTRPIAVPRLIVRVLPRDGENISSVIAISVIVGRTS